MRVEGVATNQDLILRSAPFARVSKDTPQGTSQRHIRRPESAFANQLLQE
jgi:hypothetical protein